MRLSQVASRYPKQSLLVFSLPHLVLSRFMLSRIQLTCLPFLIGSCLVISCPNSAYNLYHYGPSCNLLSQLVLSRFTALYPVALSGFISYDVVLFCFAVSCRIQSCPPLPWFVVCCLIAERCESKNAAGSQRSGRRNMH